MPTSRMIEAFRAVILQGSISEAATHMNISQPAVSRLIRDLEAEIGYRLFERRRGRVYAKEEALELYEEVHRSYVGLDRIGQAAKQIGQRQATTLRIACLPAVGLSVMPRAISRFRRDNPGIALSLQIVRSTTVIQFLTAMQCDIGFAESSFQSPILASGPHFDLDTVCVLPTGHPLAERDEITPPDLAGQRFISLDPDSQTRLKIDAVCNAAGITRRMDTEVPLTSAACALVLEGCGISIVDPPTARTFAPLGLVTRKFRPSVQFSFGTLVVPRMQDSSLVSSFLDAFSETLEAAVV